MHCFPLNQVCVHCWLTLLWIPTMVVATPTKKAWVIQLRKLNWTYKKIGKELGFDKSTVQRVAKDYLRYCSYYHRKGKPGCPKKLSEYDALLAVQRIWSGQAWDASDLQCKEFPHVLRQTVSHVLTEKGLPARRRWKKFYLTPKHIGKRRVWASAHQKWGVRKWRDVVFTDESKFNIWGSDEAQWCRRGPNEAFEKRNPKERPKHGGGKVMVWGCITSRGFGRLHRVKGNMDQFQYVEILEQSLLGTLWDQGLSFRQVIFQQDNDPKHTSKHAREFINKHFPKQLNWPPNSPDMSIIEHAWDELEHCIGKRPRHAHNEDELWRWLQEEWANLGEEYKNRLYDSMPHRVEALRVARGRHTKY